MEVNIIDKKFLQFYADKYENYSNKLFSFQIVHQSEVLRILMHFYKNNNNFRSIYLKEKIGVNDHTVDSSKELITLYNFFKISDIKRTDNLPTCIEKYNTFKNQM